MSNVLRSFDDISFSVASFRVEAVSLRQADKRLYHAILGKLVVGSDTERHSEHSPFEHLIQVAEAFF